MLVSSLQSPGTCLGMYIYWNGCARRQTFFTPLPDKMLLSGSGEKNVYVSVEALLVPA